MGSDSAINVLHRPHGVSDFPEEWGWKRLDQVAVVIDCPHTTPDITEFGPLMVRTQDIRTGTFLAEQAAHVSEETYLERIERGEPQYGDLLFSREGTYFGIAAEVPKNRRVCLGQRMVLIQPDSAQVNFRFLRYWLNSPILAQHLEGFYAGTTAQRLNLRAIRAIAVPLPPLVFQSRIADILGTLDDKIDLNRGMNRTLEAMARALFKSWFVDFDPVRAKQRGEASAGVDAETAALFPERLVDSELGEIPEGWGVKPLKEEMKIVWGCSPPGDTYNEDGDGLPFFQGSKEFGERFPIVSRYCTDPKRIAQPGDTLMSIRAPVGTMNIADRKCIVGRGLTAVQHNSQSKSYTYYGMQNLTAQFDKYAADGTVFKSITKRDFVAIPVLSPPAQLIERFEQLVGPMDAKIFANAQESLALAEMRDALLPELLGGKLKLKAT